MENSINRVCQICKKDIGIQEETVYCTECTSTYHKECWDSNGGCSTIDCPQNAKGKIKYCMNCGNEVAKDERYCSQCGQNQSDDDKNLCGVCGVELSNDDEYCCNCGAKVNSNQNEENSLGENANVAENKTDLSNTSRETKKSWFKKPAGIIAIAVVLIISVFAGISIQESNQRKMMQEAINYMKDGGIKAEEMCNTYNSVWYDSIFKNYAYIDGKYYTDFNNALAAQKEVYDEDGSNTELNSNISTVGGYIKKLSNVSSNNEEQYNDLLGVYDAYEKLTDLAIDPRGSLLTYHSNVADADSELADIMKSYYSKYPEE